MFEEKEEDKQCRLEWEVFLEQWLLILRLLDTGGFCVHLFPSCVSVIVETSLS